MNLKITQHQLLILLFVGLCTLSTCVDDQEILLETTDDLSEWEEEAKSLFDDESMLTENQAMSQNSGSNKRPSHRRNAIGWSPIWEEASMVHLSVGMGLSIPVKYNDRVIAVTENFGVNLNNLSYLLFYRDEKGRKNLEIVHVMPDSAFLANTAPETPFSGMIYAEKLNGRPIKAFGYTDGEADEITVSTEPVEGSAARYSNTCISVGHYRVTTVESGGELYYSYEFTHFETTCSSSGGIPGSGGGGLGGGDYTNGSSGGGSRGIVSRDEIEKLCEPGELLNSKGECVAAINLNIGTSEYDNLNDCEKELVKEYPFEALKISENVKIAHNETIRIFGLYDKFGNGHNDCGDAFRHALFNALNSQSVGVAVSKLFGDAHECDTKASEQLEKDMDLQNNLVGRYLGKNNPNASLSDLVSLILNELDTGNLSYLSPLDSWNNIISRTKIVSSSIHCR